MSRKTIANKSVFTLLAVILLCLTYKYESIKNRLIATEVDDITSHDVFQTLEDSAEVTDHLLKLGLTPNHSVKILSINSDGLTQQQILHGRFLHLTDMHPDELNVIGGAIRKQCHKILDSVDAEDDISHKFGDALSGCDSPINLYRSTLTWIRENLKDHIDFVIWTGDNIRHDNDRTNPRTEMDIFDMNERVANDVRNTFMDNDELFESPFNRRVKIIPSLGNNDVYPHNLFAPGPTLQTREMYKIWRDFIPNEQMHTFDRGAYFLREVVPGRLVVLSINTLYWFQSNPLNDNCDNRKQPGYKLFLWLGATLKECRRRGLKVWLSGHVPPIPKNIHHSCYAKISVWMHEYRDLIIGGVWGHMNIDHWIPLDSVKAWKSIRQRLLSLNMLEEEELPFIDYTKLEEMDIFNADDNDDDDDYETVEELYRAFGIDVDDPASYRLHTFSDRYLGAPSGKVSYLEDIRDTMYAKLKGRKKGGLFSERYSIAHISSSVIPTFNPGMRVWEYNVSEFSSLGEAAAHFSIKSGLTALQGEDWTTFFEELEKQLDDEDFLASLSIELETKLEEDNFKDDDDIRRQYIDLMAVKKDKTIPNIMPEGLPLGPGFVPQTFTPEGYVQYYLDLNEINYGNMDKDWIFEYKVHYSSKEEHGLDPLLVSNWIKLGRKYAKTSLPQASDIQDHNESAEKCWKQYVDRAFISSGYQNLPNAVR